MACTSREARASGRLSEPMPQYRSTEGRAGSGAANRSAVS